MRTLLLTALIAPQLHAQPLEIRFDQPPKTSSDEAGFPNSNWESQAQPVGNGRIGAMVFGNPLKERIQFNDSSLWTGGANPSGGYDVNEFGSYQNFGNLHLELKSDGNHEFVSRSLDLNTGIHTTTWKQKDATVIREVFASKPDQVIVIRIQSEQPGGVSGQVGITGAHQEATLAADSELSFSGTLANGMRKSAKLKVISDQGSVKTDGSRLAFTGKSVTLILAAATDYVLDPAKNFRSGVDPAKTVADQISAAAAQTYASLRQNHIGDFQKIMSRVRLDLGPPPAETCILKRLQAYKKGGEDPHLEGLMFQYGRYLLASSSRGFLPANLQGLWNESNKPAWFADYHTNINIQMNYWLAEPANLSECAKPLFNWTVAMVPGSREATLKAFGEKTPGWTMRTSVNIFGGNGWQWNLPASAWLAQHFWEHYAFTNDKAFLENTAWPVFNDVCLYWLDHLVEKDGKLVVPNGWSPEHGPREDGVAHDQQIVWDLFTNVIEAAKLLGKSDPLVGKITAAREKLLGPRIGSWGQIMEWTTERPELEKSGHRHTSHLFALHPGRQFTLHGTPDLAKAAAVSLEARGTSGDSRRSWTWAWRTAMWARLGQPDKAGEMIRGLLAHNTLDNLFTTHPPFQIDGNLGITAGICEMLVQSHAGEISILPAASPKWKNGSVSGLKARGGFEIGAVWRDGKFTSTLIRSLSGNPAVVRIHGAPEDVLFKVKDGAELRIKPDQDGLFRFPTKAGSLYQLIR